MLATLPIRISDDQIEAFCRRWRITELALFGSVLREDFGPESDVDVLVTFEEDAPWDAFDLVDVRDELGHIFGHAVSLAEKPAIRNPIRRRYILSEARVIYAA